MGILDIAKTSKQKLTPTVLKRKGFVKIPWGAPDKAATCKSYPSEFKTKPHWNKEHKCWELRFEGAKDSGCIIYFPKGFSSYVTTFLGAPPANTVIVMPDWSESNEIFKNINNEFDLNILISKLEKKYKIYEYA